MKKVLCYITIVFCIVLIILPPMFRIIFANRNDNKIKDSVQLLSCQKNDSKLSLSYLNGLPQIFKYTLKDKNLDIDSYTCGESGTLNCSAGTLLYSVKNASMVNREEDSNQIVYTLRLDDSGTQSFFSNNIKGISEQQIEFGSMGYSCSIIE